MKFLAQIHRSIVDPSFYTEILSFTRFRVIAYLVKLIVLTVTISGVSNMYYSIDVEKGIPFLVSALFQGISVENGRLVSEVELPVIIQSADIIPIVNRMTGLSTAISGGSDSVLVVDTSSAREWFTHKKPGIHFTSTGIKVYSYGSSFVEQTYESLLKPRSDFKFSVFEIRSLMVENMAALVVNAIVIQFFIFSFTMIFALFFLAFAAYIFRIDRRKSLKNFFRIACFASTPIAVGNILVAISGVHLAWTWHVMIFVCTVVMFRAIVGINSSLKPGAEDIS